MPSLPPDLVERARAFARGTGEVSPTRDAATVVLLRDRPAGPEVYLLRRAPSMAFAAGMHVFPGGSVDPRDSAQATGWAGPPPQHWAGLLDCDEELARALVCAAVRETFEESGILLAGSSPDDVVADTTGASWEADRLALLDRSVSLAELLARRGLVLRSDLLRVWGHWITPEFEPRRFDTRFFVAAVPEGQRTRDMGGEADQVVWLAVSEAVRRHDSGELAMLPADRGDPPRAHGVRRGARRPGGGPRRRTAHAPRCGRGGRRAARARRTGRRAAGRRGAAVTGGRLPSWCSLVRADNPSPMTLEGTNTYVLRRPDADGAIVVDPGPLDARHLTAVAEHGPVQLILLTHGHADHAEGALLFQEMTGARMTAVDPAYAVGERPLAGSASFDDVGGLRVRVLRTPGHTSDSVSFLVDDDEPAVLTGDTVLGRGTTVVAHPDGQLAPLPRLAVPAAAARARSPCCRATGRSGTTRARWPGSTSCTARSASTRCGRR